MGLAMCLPPQHLIRACLMACLQSSEPQLPYLHVRVDLQLLALV